MLNMEKNKMCSKKDLVINGKPERIIADDELSLATVIREQLGLTGTKVGCKAGQCGICSVILDGKDCAFLYYQDEKGARRRRHHDDRGDRQQGASPSVTSSLDEIRSGPMRFLYPWVYRFGQGAFRSKSCPHAGGSKAMVPKTS